MNFWKNSIPVSVLDCFRYNENNIVRSLAKDAGFPVKISSMEFKKGWNEFNNCLSEFRGLKEFNRGKSFGWYSFSFAYDATPLMVQRVLGPLICNSKLPNEIQLRFSKYLPETTKVIGEILSESINTTKITIAPTGSRDLLCSSVPEGKGFVYMSGGPTLHKVALDLHKENKCERIVFAGPTGLQPIFAFNGSDPAQAP